MANIKFSELTEKTAPHKNDLLVIADMENDLSKSVKYGTIRPYKIWAALCTDGGTVLGAQVLVNELGGTVVFSKLGDGNFRGTLAGAFPVGRTVSPQDQEFCYSPDLEENYNLLVLTVHNNYFDIVTRDTASMALPNALKNKFIEIRVYN